MGKIIVIEDEELVRVNLEAFLEDEGYEVLTAGSGAEGLNLIKENSDLRLGVVDLRLPDTEGTNVVLEAKKINPHINFVIYTGSTEFELPDELKEVGMHDKQLMYKPLIEMSRLTDILDTL